MALLGFTTFSDRVPLSANTSGFYGLPVEAEKTSAAKSRFEGVGGGRAVRARTTTTSTSLFTLSLAQFQTPSIIIGFAFYKNSNSSNPTIVRLSANRASSPSANDRIFDVAISSSGILTASSTFGNGGTPWEDSAGSVVSPETWHYVEALVSIGSAGYYEVRLDGATVLSGDRDIRYGTHAPEHLVSGTVTGGNTSSTSETNANVTVFQDLYLADLSGPAPWNTFLGDVHASILDPVSDGSVIEFDGSDGNQDDNYLQVSGAPELAVFNASNVPEAKDLYEVSALDPGSNRVLAVEVFALGSKESEGNALLSPMLKNSSGEQAASPTGLTSDLTPVSGLFPVAPDGSQWTASSVENTEVGVMIPDE